MLCVLCTAGPARVRGKSDGARGGVRHALGMGSPCGRPSAHTAERQPAPAGKRSLESIHATTGHLSRGLPSGYP